MVGGLSGAVSAGVQLACLRDGLGGEGYAAVHGIRQGEHLIQGTGQGEGEYRAYGGRYQKRLGARDHERQNRLHEGRER